MKKIVTQIGTIHNLSHEGRGIARYQEKVVFVEGALPGEEVKWQLTKRRSGFDLAQAIEILTPSQDRAIPCCPHYEQCGGCSLQHMSTIKQLQFKQNAIDEQLKHHLNVEQLPWVDPITSSDQHYRRKARIGVKYLYKKERLIIGFHQRNGRYLADISRCPILSEVIGEHIEELRELLMQLSIHDQIAQLEVAVGDNGCYLVVRILAPATDHDRRLLAEFSKQHQIYFYLQESDLSSIRPLLPDQPVPSYHLQIEDSRLQMQFSPVGFIQINGEVNQKLVNQVVKWLSPKPGDRIVDLFCGIGNFTLPLVRLGAEVLGIEGEGSAVDYAKLNTEFNALTNASFKTLDLSDTEQLNTISDTLASADKLLLDPPRAGAAELMQLIVNLPYAPSTIVYVSCNPATLVRDCTILVTAGYQIVKIGIADMYPHTAHVETTVLLEREGAKLTGFHIQNSDPKFNPYHRHHSV